MTLTSTPRPVGATRPRTSDQSAPLARLLDVLRGLWAVLRLVSGAVAALVTAALGVPPALPNRLGHVIADEYRAGRAGAINGDIVHDPAGDPTGDPADASIDIVPVQEKEDRR